MLMKKKNIYSVIFIVSLFVFGNIQAQDNKSILWKISGNGLKQSSYLFGTHHLVPASFAESVKGLQTALANSEQMAGELDMSNMQELQMRIMQAGLMPSDKTYQKLLSADDYALLDKTIKELMGTGIDNFQKMNPAMLSTVLTVFITKKYYPEFGDGGSLDENFQKQMRMKQKPVLGLETVDDQIKTLFQSSTTERQAEVLMCMVKYQDKTKSQLQQLTEAYQSYDLDKLFKITTDKHPDASCNSTKEEMDNLLKIRNNNWMKKIPSIIADRPTFIAVGALHLVGEDGLITSLRKLGYTVTPVK